MGDEAFDYVIVGAAGRRAACSPTGSAKTAAAPSSCLNMAEPTAGC